MISGGHHGGACGLGGGTTEPPQPSCCQVHREILQITVWVSCAHGGDGGVAGGARGGDEQERAAGQLLHGGVGVEVEHPEGTDRGQHHHQVPLLRVRQRPVQPEEGRQDRLPVHRKHGRQRQEHHEGHRALGGRGPGQSQPALRGDAGGVLQTPQEDHPPHQDQDGLEPQRRQDEPQPPRPQQVIIHQTVSSIHHTPVVDHIHHHRMPLATRLSSPRKVLLTPSRNSSSSLLGQGIAFSLITLASLWFSLWSSAKLRAQQAPATSPSSLKQVPTPLVLSYSPQVENSSSWSTMNSLSLPPLEMWVLTCTRPQMKKNTSSSLSPSPFRVLPFSNLRCSMDSATCIFSSWVRLLKYSFTSMKCTHFLISSPRVKFLLTAPSFILITLHPSTATTLSLRFSSPNRISVCPNTRSTPNYLLAPSSEDTSTLPSSTTQMYLSRPPSPSLLYMSAPLSQATASWLMHRLTKCYDVVSKKRLKKGRRLRDLAISMPSKGIFSYSSLESTLKICCISPRTYRLLSSISILIQSIVINAPETPPHSGHRRHPRRLPPPVLRVGEAGEEQLDRQRHLAQPPRHPLPREEPLPPPLRPLPTPLVVRAVPNATQKGSSSNK